MKKIISILTLAAVLSFSLASCSADKPSETVTSTESSSISITEESTAASEKATEAVTEAVDEKYPLEMLDEERESIVVGKLSTEHEFYEEVVTYDPECADYITEISIYDKEIDDTFVVHVSLPPEYDSSKKYPLILMTDGVWRLSDHPELRTLMKNGEIEQVIIASVGYPNGYDYGTIREREFLQQPEKYLHFIVDNLVPYLSLQYSIDSENMTLAGHSYGGYWDFYALFNSDTIGKNTFKNYLVGSPAFSGSTGDENIQTFEEAYYERNKTLNCNVYITVGSDEWPGFIDSIDSFVEFFKNRNYENLNMKYEIFDGYDHNHSFKPALKKFMIMYYGAENNQEQENN